ncbi:MAG: delta-60 repeat domain-containing protein, partial [Microthrixaceae bacterium]
MTSATAEIAPTVYRTDGVSGQWTGPTTNTVSSPIWDMQVIGNTVYVAGKFLNVVEARGSWPEIPQPFLAAFDATSGEWIDWWRPELDAPVWALDQTADGRLLAAGEFDTVNGQPRGNLVALDARTGEIDPQFNAGVERPWTTAQSVIRDLYRDGDDLYLIGNFSHVNGGPNGLRTQVGKAARVDANNGTPDTVWKPQIQGRSGWGITTSSDGARVHLGGEFSSVNGQPDSKLLATVNATDGASVPGWDGGPNWSEHPVWPEGGIVYDIGVVGNNLFVAGAEHFWEMRSSTTGASLKLAPSTNDTQSVDVIDGRVYIGCHCDGRGNYSPGKQMRVIDGNTGTELTDITGNLRSGDGGWGTAKAPDGCLWLGGEFWGTTSLKDHPAGLRWVGNFARMCDAAGPLPHNVPSLVRPGDPLPEDLLIQPGDGWRYLSNDTHPAGWTTRAFDDSGWAAGASELGFGDGDEATVVPNAVGGQPITSALFRRSFDVPDPAEVDYLTVDLNVDDGATVWINGVPVVAENMPNGEIGAPTLASQAVWGAAESDFTRYEVPSN